MTASTAGSAPAGTSSSAPPVKKEVPLDPLKADIDEEEMEYEPDRLNMELEVCQFVEFMVSRNETNGTRAWNLLDSFHVACRYITRP